jgi:hypothetical protein
VAKSLVSVKVVDSVATLMSVGRERGLCVLAFALAAAAADNRMGKETGRE